MKRLLLVSLFLAACGPSEGAVQTTIAKTEAARPIETIEPTATLTTTLAAIHTPTARSTVILSNFEQSLAWTRQFGTSVTDWLSDVASDRLGNVYIVGSLGTDQPGGFGITGTLRKYNAEGELLWTRQMEPAPGGFSKYSVTTDDAGNVYVGGQSSAKSSETFSFVRKYDAEGIEIWMQALPSSQATHASDVAADAEGGVYVVGRARFMPEGEGEEGTVESFLRKYSTTGEVLWTQLLSQGVNGLTLKVFVGIDGNIRVAGSLSDALPGETSAGGWDIFVQSYTRMGEEIWTHQFGSAEDDFIEDSTVDGAGNVYVAYKGGDFPMLSKYDASGKQLWTRQLDSRSTKLMSLAIGPEGNLYVLLNRNWPFGFPDADVRKLDSMGNEVWSFVFPSSWPAIPELIVIDNFGSLYLGGGTSGPLPGHTESGAGDVFLLRMK